jgi:UDP-glucose 6-dehydrogenase
MGLGMRGALIAAVPADTGRRVAGADLDRAVAAPISAGRSPRLEPGLEQQTTKPATSFTRFSPEG